jgi:hypothetical protein
MKARLRADPSLEQFRRDFIVVARELGEVDFQWLSQRYPVSFDRVPMIYVIAPTGELLYANSGALEVAELVALQDAALEITGDPLSQAEVDRNEHLLDLVRQAARSSRLGEALELVAEVRSQRSSAGSVLTAGRYEKQLVRAISATAAHLGGQLAEGCRTHESAYRLARLYVGTPRSYERLRAEILAEIRRHEDRTATRSAVMQAKQLVRAQFEERRQLTAAAVASLERVVALEPESPIGRYAARHVIRLRQRMADVPVTAAK